MPRRAATLADLPLFSSDEAIAAALMGPGKTVEWRQIAALLEARGLPKINALMGGRYVPAVKAFFDREYDLLESAPRRAAADGVERLGAWRNETKRRVRRI